MIQFRTVMEAKLSMSRCEVATCRLDRFVNRDGPQVRITTSDGMGVFPLSQWEEAKKPHASRTAISGKNKRY